ncbi:MAG: histidinol-phosphatase [Muribaculaceae bacterium]|nr:histidinol-phosphatase [Muribaculaceae bacterium]
MIDFAEITSHTHLYNFHSHTQFCDGRATMEEFAAAAAAEGFTHYGFSPHSPVPIESPCNMSMDDVDIYIKEYNRLKEHYRHRVNLYLAMEIDYLGPGWGPASDYFKTLPLDYRIGSVHFIPSAEGMIDVDGRFESFKAKMQRYFSNDIRAVVESFYSQTNKMIDAGGFDIIGHFDKIGHNASHFSPGIEDTAWYRQLVNDTIDNIIAHNITVEINTKARADHNRFFPNEAYWKRLADAGVTIVVNSDVHFPNLINASRSEALSLLDNLKNNPAQ